MFCVDYLSRKAYNNRDKYGDDPMSIIEQIRNRMEVMDSREILMTSDFEIYQTLQLLENA